MDLFRRHWVSRARRDRRIPHGWFGADRVVGHARPARRAASSRTRWPLAGGLALCVLTAPKVHALPAFSFATPYTSIAFGNPRALDNVGSIAAGDLNGDGMPD